MFRLNCFMVGVLTCGGALAQNFTVGQWFAGKNVTAELPQGTVDIADSFWASDTNTCILAMSGSRGAPQTQLACRAHTPGARFETVIAEGDTRLGNTRLAVVTTPSNDTGRHLAAMVRPEPRNLYFTTFTGTNAATYSNQIAWRYRDYKTLEKVAAAGDRIAVRLPTGTPTVTLSVAGPIDADENGREFIYLESAASNVYGLFEIKGPGVYESLFQGVIRMRDTPWGAGGFTFSDGGLMFRQAVSLYQLDPNTKGLGIFGQEGVMGQPFMPAGVNYANIDVAQFFRPTHDLTTFFFNWGSVQGTQAPNEFFSVWRDWTQAPFYTNALGSPNASTASVIAAGDRVTVMGTGPRGPSTTDFDPTSRIAVQWPMTTLWLNRGGTWQRILNEAQVPEGTPQRKKFYTGLTAYRCSVEFATKQNDGSTDNSGALAGFYRLTRPCLDSATFNTVTRDLTITGINLLDLSTEIGVPVDQAGAPLGRVVAHRIESVTPTEIKAKLDNISTLERVSVLLNGAVWSDPVSVKLVTQPAPILANNLDMNFDQTNPSPSKLMTITGELGCQTESAQSVNYPTVLGNCSVIMDGTTRLPLLYASHTQINYLLPADLTVFSHNVRVTRTDANGVFSSEAYIFTSAPHWPVPIKNGGRPIVVVIRNGQVVVLGPNDTVRPGEFFTFYLTGALVGSLPQRALLGEAEIPFAAAVVSWAQGVVQVNVQAPAASTATSLTLGLTVTIPVTVGP